MSSTMQLLSRLIVMREVIESGDLDPETLAEWDEVIEMVTICLFDDAPQLSRLTLAEREAAARQLVVEFLEKRFPVLTLH